MIIAGKIEKIDLNKRTFQIRDAKGESQSFLFSKTAETGEVKLQEIKIGDEVTVTTVIKGRAEAIEIKEPKFEKPKLRLEKKFEEHPIEQKR